MIADKGFLHSIWPVDFDQRQRKLYGEYSLQEAEREVGQQSLIRGSGRMTLLRLGLPLSSWRALKAQSAREGSPALFRSQRRIPRRDHTLSFSLLLSLDQMFA